MPLESPPIEKVNFLLDEMANMVWAVEAVIPSPPGKGIDGYEALLEIENSGQLCCLLYIRLRRKSDTSEEVPRSGKIVSRSYQGCRWTGEKVVVRVGRRATIGKGEGTSALRICASAPLSSGDAPSS